MSYDKITISGLICTGKSTLFEGLRRELSWPSFSASQFFRTYSKEHHLSLEKAEEQEENITKSVDLHMQQMLKAPGNLLVEGWMAGIMADKFPKVLRMLLTSDDSIRAQRFATRSNIAHDEAKKQIQEREGNLFRKLKAIYARDDIAEPKNYNFVLNTTQVDPEQMVHTVLKKLKK